MRKSKCEALKDEPEDNYTQFNQILKMYDDDLDTIAKIIENPTQKMLEYSIERLTGNVTISGIEKSNKGNGMLGVPTKINGLMRHELGAGCDRMAGGLPSANISGDLIGDELELLLRRLAQQGQEVNHLANSRIKGLKYVLQPTGLNRQTFWLARGADVPRWFPGFFTVFQDSFDFKPANQVSHSSAFLHAWRTMAPMISQDS